MKKPDFLEEFATKKGIRTRKRAIPTVAGLVEYGMAPYADGSMGWKAVFTNLELPQPFSINAPLEGNGQLCTKSDFLNLLHAVAQTAVELYGPFELGDADDPT